MSIRISPSILSADFSILGQELESISSADLIHVDVMDGHFVPNLTLGLPVVKRLGEITTVPLDVHLMIDDPDFWAVKYAQLGVQSVTFHLEAAKNPRAIIRDLKNAGVQAAIAIKPATNVEDVVEFLSEVDMILVMTVEPGFGGQPLIPETLSKVTKLRDIVETAGLSNSIQVDGGITLENIATVSSAGADCFVAGTTVFSAQDRNDVINRLRFQASNL